MSSRELAPPAKRMLAIIAEVDPPRAGLDPRAAPNGAVQADLAYAAELARGQRAPATARAYNADLAVLAEYLTDRGLPERLPIDAQTLASFLGAEGRPDTRPGRERPAREIATIERRLAAISKAHQILELADPTKDPVVRGTLAGLRRRRAGDGHSSHAKAALSLEDLQHMLAPRDARNPHGIDLGTHTGRRDKALLLVAIAGALRRSEVVALDVADVRFVAEGMLVSIRRSKTDQAGHGQTLAIARGDNPNLCAVVALQAWLRGAAIQHGPIFRRVRAGDRPTQDRLSDKAVARTVKKYVERVGLAPAVFAGHSLRSGGITAAVREGHDEREIARLSRHRDMNVLRGYIQRDDAFEDAAQVLASRKR